MSETLEKSISNLDSEEATTSSSEQLEEPTSQTEFTESFSPSSTDALEEDSVVKSNLEFIDSISNDELEKEILEDSESSNLVGETNLTLLKLIKLVINDKRKLVNAIRKLIDA